MSFHRTRIPSFISPFIICSPSFSTSIVQTSSGREIRSADHTEQISKYIIKDCKLSLQQFEIFNGFFKARQGQKFSFLLHDIADFRVDNQVLEQTDIGTRIGYFLYKIYQDRLFPVRKYIAHPKEDTIKIFINGTASSSGFSIHGTEIKLQALVPEGQLSVSFDFDIEIRFNQDSFNYSFRPDGAIQLSDIELIEVLSSNKH